LDFFGEKGRDYRDPPRICKRGRPGVSIGSQGGPAAALANFRILSHSPRLASSCDDDTRRYFAGRRGPTRDDFAHSSLITGYNLARREVIFNRRMRIEEMEGTGSLAYCPHL
jgi:hypothetical protein